VKQAWELQEQGAISNLMQYLPWQHEHHSHGLWLIFVGAVRIFKTHEFVLARAGQCIKLCEDESYIMSHVYVYVYVSSLDTVVYGVCRKVGNVLLFGTS